MPATNIPLISEHNLFAAFVSAEIKSRRMRCVAHVLYIRKPRSDYKNTDGKLFKGKLGDLGINMRITKKFREIRYEDVN